MGMFVSNRRSRPRRFDYEPRYYDPTKDEGIKRRMRVQSRARRRRDPSGIIYLAMLLILALFIYGSLM